MGKSTEPLKTRQYVTAETLTAVLKKGYQKSLPKKASATLSAKRYFAMKSQSLLYPVDSSQSFMFARRIL